MDGGGPRAGAPDVGIEPGVHPGHAEPVVAGRPVLQGRAGQEGGHRLLGRLLPHLLAQPDLPAGLRRRRGRGRALVDPHLHPAPRGGGPGAAGRGHGLVAALLDGRERRLRRGRDPVRTRRPGVAARSRRGAHPRGGSRHCGQRRPQPSAARRCVGSARRSQGRGGHRRAGDRRPLALRPSGAHPRPPGAGGRRDPVRRPPGGAVRERHAGRRLRRGRRLLGPGPRRLPGGLRRLRPPLVPRARDAGRVPAAAGTRSHRAAAGTRRSGVVAGRRGGLARRRGRSDDGLGDGRGMGGARAAGAHRRHPSRCRAGRRRSRQPGCVGRGGRGPGLGPPRRADRRARTLGLHAHARRPLHLQPPVVPGRHHAHRRLPRARVVDRGAGDHEHRLPGGGAGRPPRQPQLHAGAGGGVPGRLGGGQRRRLPCR